MTMAVLKIACSFLLGVMCAQSHENDEACHEEQGIKVGSKGTTCKPLLQVQLGSRVQSKVGCPAWCGNSPATWSAKCKWAGCSKCTDSCGSGGSSGSSSASPKPSTPPPTSTPSSSYPACKSWCDATDSETKTKRCQTQFCQSCSFCPAVTCDSDCVGLAREFCDRPSCKACDSCFEVLPQLKEAVKTEDDSIDLKTGVQELCTENGCMPLRGFVNPEAPGTLGPTIRAIPGEVLKLKLINDFAEYPDDDVPHDPSNPHANSHRLFNHTGLHVHGLHVSGRDLRTEGGTLQDHVLIKLPPQQNLTYEIDVPGDHMGGIHWYHPHTHHSTAFQAATGLAGLIIVENALDNVPTWLSELEEFWMMVTVINGPVLTKYSLEGNDGLKLYENSAAKKFAEAYKDGLIYVNQVPVPFVELAAGKWSRFRMVFASVEQQLGLELAEISGEEAAECEMQLVAKDGIYLPKFPRQITYVHLFAGARADFAIQCWCPVGADECWTKFQSSRRNHFTQYKMRDGFLISPAVHEGDVLRVKVLGKTRPGSPLSPPSGSTVNRPCYLRDLRNEDVPTKNKHTLYMHSEMMAWDSKGYRNGDLKVMPELPEDEEQMKNEAMGEVPINSVIELTIRGTTEHPFHLHVNPFQMMGYNPTRLSAEIKEYYQDGDWHDTILSPEFQGKDITIRFLTHKFDGEMVAHCHTLSHEDMGMIGWLWVSDANDGGICKGE